MADSHPVLDLNTIFTRTIVRIDGEPYELRSSGEFSIAEELRFDRYADRINALLAEASLTPEEEAELSQLTDARCRMALVAPDEVHQRLTDRQRSQVLATFFQPQPIVPVAVAAAAPASDAPETATSEHATGAN